MPELPIHSVAFEAGWTGLALSALALFAKVSLLLGLAWAVTVLLRRRSAALRHAVWGGALVLAVLLPFLASGLPRWEVPAPWLAGRAVAPGVEHTDKSVSHADRMGTVPMPASPVVVAPTVARPVEGVSEAVEDVSETTGLAARSLAAYLVLVWLGGTVLLMGRIVLHLARIARITRQAWAEPESEAARTAAGVARLLGVRRRVRVLHTDRIDMPVTWGALRPVVLLPEDASRWPEARLRVVLLHEMAHVRRWDYLAHLFAECAGALYWPDPLVWLARRRVQAEQEQACDDRVIATGTRSYEYAEHLLAIATALQSRGWSWGAIGMAREVSLKERIRSILNHQTDRRPLSRRSALLLAGALTAVALPVAALTPGSAPVPESAPPDDAAEAPAGPVADPVETGPHDEPEPPAADPQGPQHFWMEAEQAVVRPPMIVDGDVDASGARSVLVPDADGNDAPEGGSGSVTFHLDVAREADYVVWARVVGPADNDNSFYVSVDGGPEMAFHVLDEDGEPEVDAWTWLRVGTRSEDGRFVLEHYRLAPGRHSLRFRNREDGTRLDRVLVTDDAGYVPQDRGPAPAGLRPVYRWFEAEDARLARPMRPAPDPHASGQRYVAVPADGPDGEGAVEVTFDVEQAGRYVVWARVRAPRPDQNSFFAAMDGGAEVVWDVPGLDPEETTERWAWDTVSSREGGREHDPVLYDLEPGRHTLRLRAREAGTSLDGIFVTNDLGYRPRGMRAVLPPAEPVYLWMEAEHAARLDRPWELRRDERASNLTALVADADRASLDRPPAGGRALYAFDVRRPGLYKVWGRIIAPGGGEDSFWVRMDGGRWIKWNSVRHGRRWHWDEVHDDDYGEELVPFELAAGAHTLEFAYREGGASLDRLLVTNDPSFVPSGTGRSARDGARGEPPVEVVFRRP